MNCSWETDDRTIHWYWDAEGNSGKTAFCKYMYKWEQAVILQGGKYADIAYAMPEYPHMVLMNIPRSSELVVNYSAIEAIKDGLMFSGKYESKMKMWNPPHLVVFANFEPNKEQLSKDRWHVVKIPSVRGTGWRG